MPNGTVGSQYSALVPLLDKPDIYNKLISLYKDDDFTRFMFMSDKMQKLLTRNEVFSSTYDAPLYVAVDTTAATVTGSASATVTVTSLAAAQSGQLIVSDLVQFPNGKVGRVMTKTTTSGQDTITIQSVDGTNLTLAAGNILSLFSNAQEEGSFAPDPRRWPVNTLSNKVQIFRKTVEATDIAKAKYAYFDVDGQPAYVNLAKWKGLMMHRSDIAFAFWMGQISTTTFSDANPAMVGARGYGVQTTRGMDQYITSYGINDSVTTPGTIVLADIKDFSNRLDAARAPMKYMLAGGGAPMNSLSDFLKNLPSAGVLPGVKYEVEGRTVDLEVERWFYGGREFNNRRFEVFNNQQVFNAASNVRKSIYALPDGKVDTVDGGMVDYFQARYMPVIHPGDGTPMQAEVHTGALAPRPTSGTAVESVTYESIMGLEVLAPQFFARLTTEA